MKARKIIIATATREGRSAAVYGHVGGVRFYATLSEGEQGRTRTLLRDTLMEAAQVAAEWLDKTSRKAAA